MEKVTFRVNAPVVVKTTALTADPLTTGVKTALSIVHSTDATTANKKATNPKIVQMKESNIPINNKKNVIIANSMGIWQKIAN